MSAAVVVKKSSSSYLPSRWTTLALILLCLGLSACSGSRFLRPHKIAIQQGNVITQEMVDRLKPGMTKKQVKFVLGTPLIVDTLNFDEWHYIYSLRLGNGDTLKKVFTVLFADNKLTEITGDYKPTTEE